MWLAWATGTFVGGEPGRGVNNGSPRLHRDIELALRVRGRVARQRVGAVGRVPEDEVQVVAVQLKRGRSREILYRIAYDAETLEDHTARIRGTILECPDVVAVVLVRATP